MYNEREKLLHHQQLLSPKEAAADLALLKQLKPNHPRLGEFDFSPKRCAGDILMALLDIAHRDDIVKNRLRHTYKAGPAPKPDPEKKVLKEQLKEKEEEVDDLQGQLEEKEDQLEEKENQILDIEEQLEEKESQIADLEEQLEEEKKSESPKKAPAKKAPRKASGSKKK